MEVLALAWRDDNEAKLALHGILRAEAEELIGADNWVGYVHPDYPEQVRAVGPTQNGRLLTLVLAPTSSPAVWRPVTGWDSTAEETEYYWEENR